MRDITDYKRNMQRNENQSNRDKTDIERESMHDNISRYKIELFCVVLPWASAWLATLRWERLCLQQYYQQYSKIYIHTLIEELRASIYKNTLATSWKIRVR